MGVLGLGYSLKDCSFNQDNYSSHHALGTLADHLVRKGLLLLPPQETRTTGPRGRQTSRPSPRTPRPSGRQTPHTNYSTHAPTHGLMQLFSSFSFFLGFKKMLLVCSPFRSPHSRKQQATLPPDCSNKMMHTTWKNKWVNFSCITYNQLQPCAFIMYHL